MPDQLIVIKAAKKVVLHDELFYYFFCMYMDGYTCVLDTLTCEYPCIWRLHHRLVLGVFLIHSPSLYDEVVVFTEA